MTADLPTTDVVMLTEAGARERVLDGKAGMVFVVDHYTDRLSGDGRMAHVRDYRSQGPDQVPRDFQTWSLAPEHYSLVGPIPRPDRLTQDRLDAITDAAGEGHRGRGDFYFVESPMPDCVTIMDCDGDTVATIPADAATPAGLRLAWQMFRRGRDQGERSGAIGARHEILKALGVNTLVDQAVQRLDQSTESRLERLERMLR